MSDSTENPRHLDVLRGTLDMFILRALTSEPMHGYGIARWLERATGDALSVEEGSLYPALARMYKRGWVRREWGISDNNRRARFYRLTEAGARQLEAKKADWLAFTRMTAQVLDTESA